MSAALTTTIAVRDRNGNVIEEREVATYAGLLARAHEEGLTSIRTELLQVPNEANGMMAIVQATVETKKGTFTGIGDANPGNVTRNIAPHIIRMAETRAKARALRDAVNIGLVALEELGDMGAEVEAPTPAKPPSNIRPLRPRATDSAPSAVHGGAKDNRAPSRRDSEAMTEAQRRLLFRMLAEQGYEGEEAVDVLCESAGVEKLSELTKVRASALIDSWKRQAAAAGGGHAS